MTPPTYKQTKLSLISQARFSAVQRVIDEHREDYDRYHREERELRGLPPELTSTSSLLAENRRLRQLLAERGIEVPA